MFGLFGKKPKFKLQEKMEVELEFSIPDGLKSYFSKVMEVSKKRATFATPKEGNRYVSINPNDIIKIVVLIEDTIFEVNLKVTASMDKEFEALVSKNVNRFDTILKDRKKNEEVKLEVEVPLDFRAITTSHVQRATTNIITKEYIDMVTNLPIPEGTDLKLYFKIPETPVIETEGKATENEPLKESKKSKTKITFPEKVTESDVFKDIEKYVLHFQRREERRKELEESQQEGELPPTNKK
ncbi:MAG: hypothetical protein K8T10_17600 [Candidatus Eremiobacteraeota bacterium]|nr:hypothetical protein [Candidatus Eremiobacteraeota bacterium]